MNYHPQNCCASCLGTSLRRESCTGGRGLQICLMTRHPTQNSSAGRLTPEVAEKKRSLQLVAGDTSGGKVLGLSFSAHRVIFAIVHGKYPAGDTDHINGDKADNRIANLREVTHAENARNQKIPSNNKTGVIGVSFCKREQRFVANIRCGGRQKNLGYFACITAAMIARVRASRVYGYHRNHGGR